MSCRSVDSCRQFEEFLCLHFQSHALKKLCLWTSVTVYQSILLNILEELHFQNPGCETFRSRIRRYATHQMCFLIAQLSGTTDMSITAFIVTLCYGSVQLIINITGKLYRKFPSQCCVFLDLHDFQT
jgi:hypothetical protein